MNRIKLVIGPTAIGKSDYAIQLAKKKTAEIISADAYQVYKGMNIGTGKITPAQLATVPHHLIDIKSPDEPYSAAEFVSRTNDIIANATTPIIICGGTGMYINALLHDYAFAPETPSAEVKQKVAQLPESERWEKLNQIDPASGKSIHPNNINRLTRALEIYYTTNKKPSLYRPQSSPQRPDIELIGLTTDREIVRQRISKRVDAMVAQGLFDEVETLLKTYPKTAIAFQALGYKQIIAHFEDEMNREDAIQAIKTKTHQFAKRQMTWYRRFKNVNWIEI